MQETRDFYDRRAELYDLAFSWDVEEEVEWLVERLFECTVRFVVFWVRVPRRR